MTDPGISDFAIRPAARGDGVALFDLTRSSVAELAKRHYSQAQLDAWMGERTPAFYETLIEKGRVVVAESGGAVSGFVDAQPGEITRLFLLPEAAGHGLGARLLEIGIEAAGRGHIGSIKLEATLNAEGFYRRHGFRSVGRGVFSHGLGGDPIQIIHMER